MATRLWPKQKSLFTITLILWFQLSGIVGIASFTKEPPYLQYVLHGSNATFNWDYDLGSSRGLFSATWTKIGINVNCIMQSGSSAPIKIDDPRCQHFELQGRAMLILKNVNKSMDGDYECHLNFQDGNVLRNFTALRVVSKAPTFVTSPPRVIGVEGGNAVVITVEVAGDYAPLISWHKNSTLANATQFQMSSRQIGNNANSDKVMQSNLTIPSPRRNINNHVIVAKATYGTHSPTSNASIMITVWYGPENVRVSSANSGMAVLRGQSVTVTCTADSNPPSLFTFFHNSSMILQNSTSGVLTISSFSQNDSGNYSCMAKNQVSNATVVGVWFLYAEPVITTTTTQKPSTSKASGTGQVNLTTPTTKASPNPGGSTGESSSLPWWAWLTIGIAIFLLITIPILVYCIIKRRRSKKKTQTSVPLQFSKKGFDIDSYILNTNYTLGYENNVKEGNERKVSSTDDSHNNPDPEKAKEKLGVKFESEDDLIDHYRRGPEEYDDDFKDYDPFEEDDTDGVHYPDPFASDGKDPLSYDNTIFEGDDLDDMVKVKSDSDKESDRDPELFNDLGEDIIQYDI